MRIATSSFPQTHRSPSRCRRHSAWMRKSLLTARTAADLADSTDPRSVISAALAATPVQGDALRRGVWTFVGLERDAGVSRGDVIIALTGLIDAANLSPVGRRDRELRQVILWCVEAYFGHLGGEGLGG